MASEHSMDISVDFIFQDLKNAVQQANREAANRFDLKDSDIDISLSDDNIKITAESDNQIESVYGILIKKMIAQKVSPKILNREAIKEAGGMKVRQEIKLVKSLNQENAKKIAKKIRDDFPKAKANIQGDTVRVSSKSIDELQTIMQILKDDEELNLALNFSNYK